MTAMQLTILKVEMNKVVLVNKPKSSTSKNKMLLLVSHGTQPAVSLCKSCVWSVRPPCQPLYVHSLFTLCYLVMGVNSQKTAMWLFYPGANWHLFHNNKYLMSYWAVTNQKSLFVLCLAKRGHDFREKEDLIWKLLISDENISGCLITPETCP